MNEANPASASMCIGRSARPNAPIATSTAMSATSRSTRSALPRPSRPSLRRCAPAPGRAQVTSIFLGGGTPSLMKPETVGAVLDAVAKNWTVADGAEITLEANPSSVEASRFRGYRAAGVNRVSLGVQALNDRRSQIPRPAAQCRGGADGDRPGARDLSAAFLRPDLCAARPDAGSLGGRARAGDRPCRRPSVALPADHRGRHAVPCPACGEEIRDTRAGRWRPTSMR